MLRTFSRVGSTLCTAARFTISVGSVDFKPDTASTVTDLQYDDYFEVSSRGAYWQESAGEDNIWFNDYWFAGDTVTNRRAASRTKTATL